MTRQRLWPVLFVSTILVGLAFRLPGLEKRPMHGDEAVHAIKFGALLERGDYRYDPVEYHGPTLNYLTLIPAWLGAKHKLTDVNESTLRIVPVFFGISLIILLVFWVDALGWPAVIAAAILTAISPAMAYYSRYYIQEMLLVSFTFGVLTCGIRYFGNPNWRWALATGIFLGLMHATKETFVINLAAIVLAAGIVFFLHRRSKNKSQNSDGVSRSSSAGIGVAPTKGGIARFSRGQGLSTKLNGKTRRGHYFAGIAAAVIVSILFYSSFLSNPHGILDSILSYKIYFARAAKNQWHIHPWHFYFQRLFFFQQAGSPFLSEIFIAILAAIGIHAAFAKKQSPQSNRLLHRFLAYYTIILTTIFCLLPYKTPWNVLGFWHGFILLAGIGAANLIRTFESISAKMIVILLLTAGICQLAWQSYLANFEYEADPRNPYVYAHPTKDVLAMTQRIKELAKAHTDGQHVYMQFICSGSDYWPFPWYLRDYPNIGWWNAVDENAPPAPIIVISPDLESELSRKLYELRPPGQRDLYVPFFEQEWQFRPGVELRGYVIQELWEKFYQIYENR